MTKSDYLSGIRNPDRHVQKHLNLRKLQEIQVEIPDFAAMSSESAFAVYTKAEKVNGNVSKKTSKKKRPSLVKRSAEKVMEAEAIKKEAKLINKLAGGETHSKKKLDKKRKKSATREKKDAEGGAPDKSSISEVDAFTNSLRKTGDGKAGKRRGGKIEKCNVAAGGGGVGEGVDIGGGGSAAKKKKKAGGGKEVGSVELGRQYLEWMISPVETEHFLSDSWEKRPLHIKRGDAKYYRGLFSTKELDSILREQQVLYGKNLDVTSYSKEEGRETHNPPGRAFPAVVWDYFNNGCSVRMLNPQTFSETVWKGCATLQEFFRSMVGANVYLTPPGTQGFAPHFDDVEVFMLQLEGRKRWRLYEPRSAQEKLPRFSSGNFAQDEIGDPCMDVVLEAGDLIYMPRGTIHQVERKLISYLPIISAE